MEEQATNIRVFLRIRPSANPEERQCLELVAPDTVKFSGPGTPDLRFQYDVVGGQNCTQGQVWEAVAQELTDQCLAGYNATVFAYGQTGSGKTFTMQGPGDDSCNAEESPVSGLIPRTFSYLFERINGDAEWSESDVRCCFVEIYNETIYDLLSDSGDAVRLLREDTKRNAVYIEGAREERLPDAEAALLVFRRGAVNRHVAETRMNRESSRSHSVFTLFVTRRRWVNGLEEFRESRFNLVDLAGSERQQLTGTVGVRLKEAGNINKSLLALSNVINALCDSVQSSAQPSQASSQRHVHYRDSKLTFLLRDSLGGNSRTAVIACVSPSWSCQGETLSTLRFAQRAKMIKNRAVVNQDMRGSVADLQAEIRRLQGMLANPAKGPVEQDIVTENADEFIRALVKRTRAAEEAGKQAETRRGAIEELLKRREQQLNSERLIVKFRDNALKAFQSQMQPELKEAFSEIAELRKMYESHPEIAKMTAECASLRQRIAGLEAMAVLSDASYIDGLEAKIADSIEMTGIDTFDETEKAMTVSTGVDTGPDTVIQELGAVIERLAREVRATKDSLELAKANSSSLQAELGLLKSTSAKELAAATERMESLSKQLSQASEAFSLQLAEYASKCEQLELSRKQARMFEFNLHSARQDNECLLVQMDKLSGEEHNAKEFEDLSNRLAELHAENERLRHENDKLVQHSNTKQKLQYHVKVKQENNDLKAELLAAREEVTRLNTLLGLQASPSKFIQNKVGA